MQDRSVAEDLTSETFVRALRRIDTVDYHGTQIGAWSITIARNLLFDRTRSNQYRREVSVAQISDTDLNRSTSPDTHLITTERQNRLLECVTELHPSQRVCIRLRFFLEMSVAVTAHAMQRTPGAVKTLHTAQSRPSPTYSNTATADIGVPRANGGIQSTTVRSLPGTDPTPTGPHHCSSGPRVVEFQQVRSRTRDPSRTPRTFERQAKPPETAGHRTDRPAGPPCRSATSSTVESTMDNARQHLVREVR